MKLFVFFLAILTIGMPVNLTKQKDCTCFHRNAHPCMINSVVKACGPCWNPIVGHDAWVACHGGNDCLKSHTAGYCLKKKHSCMVNSVIKACGKGCWNATIDKKAYISCKGHDCEKCDQ